MLREAVLVGLRIHNGDDPDGDADKIQVFDQLPGRPSVRADDVATRPSGWDNDRLLRLRAHRSLLPADGGMYPNPTGAMHCLGWHAAGTGIDLLG